ncbi:MAG TPA: alpha/beta-type small acid-soluble spore protein [Syntrophothermus lipocalidus]|uniref:Small acid-soluble spore protein alpha/beta type n=1 Tax=Syntrophothermus lipocalidus (strain DSM 12680 / TGB-C1) TaxID=643648 RepID=D7CLT8_SYNLT|nr:small acid-soluble spore protein alpha/beta type [Syntrophothermus lipocalidus DSM 12680]HHV77070.1 alpha/beta-type small acid-soluble spore protein [Syntrophothermus lipocalidus]
MPRKGTNNRILVPQARAAMDQFKQESATELGVPLNASYNGELTTRQAGSIGGQMVKKMILAYENNLAGGNQVSLNQVQDLQQTKQQIQQSVQNAGQPGQSY